MKSLITLTIAGVILSIWCSTAHTDRLYTWEDDKGVIHISKEQPPQKTKLIDTMDYTVTSANQNRETGKQVTNDDESMKPQRIEAQERRKAMEATGITEDADEDLYYDSDGGRYTRRAIGSEIKEERENGREKVRPATKRQRQSHHRK